MSTEPRRARLRALAKINLGLRVLHKRGDGFHELRTVFQTISLADTLDVEFEPSRRTSIELTGCDEIADNLVVRAARALMDAMRTTGKVRFHLIKRIPMGAGLGGGSSDAAAVLLALPVLAGREMAPDEMIALGAQLGSDVPYFFLGGTALGLGRGTELYPLPEIPAAPLVLVAPAIHVSTAEAYRALDLGLTSDVEQNMIDSFQSRVSFVGNGMSKGSSAGVLGNDFEGVVFDRHPELRTLKRKLLRLGARAAMMTGSGSALFGIFDSRKDAARVLPSFGREKAYSVTMVSRARYRAMWQRQMAVHCVERIWPLRSRYLRRCTIV
ncbi:MAG: 4-(cytidine 5'-diphospho)-2-C-methyl-D-erythritol kinase [Acidobacteriales bacterium]|nr:4-(cytidine 5'-diphospho)-2-C-methyl-D-erythritol kinase [Terriglobales bacterium]